MTRLKLGPDTAMYAFTSTVQLEAFTASVVHSNFSNHCSELQLVLNLQMGLRPRLEPWCPCLMMHLSRHLRPRTSRGQLGHENWAMARSRAQIQRRIPCARLWVRGTQNRENYRTYTQIWQTSRFRSFEYRRKVFTDSIVDFEVFETGSWNSR